MSFRVRLNSAIRRRIVAWGLPDSVFVEVILRLEQRLKQDPQELLWRARKPFDGMNYGFLMVDPTNRFREFLFIFQVMYSQDEEELLIVNCGYRVMSL